MGRWLFVVGITVALAMAPRSVAQSDASASDGAGAGLVAGIGDPPRFEPVSALVRDPRLADAATARAVAESLAPKGGYAVAQGLLYLVRHRDASVRFAALRGLSEVGLRRSDGVIWVRKAMRDSDALVKAAAFDAIGHLGDASDLPALLEALSSDDERTRAASGRALATLTGMTFPADDVARWNEWWKAAKGWIPVQLDRAIGKLELGGEKQDVRDARSVLAQYVWYDVEKVRGVIGGWMRNMDVRRRIEGYRALHSCRLGDLADDLRRAATDEDDPTAIALALRAARRLGVAVDAVSRAPETPGLVALLDKASDDTIDESDGNLQEMVARVLKKAEPVADGGDAARKGASAGSWHGGGGGLGGSAVFLDLDAKRARWKTLSESAATDAAAEGTRPAPDSPTFWVWLGVGLVGLLAAAALIREPLRRLRRSREIELLEETVAAPAPLWQGGKDLTINELLERELQNAGIVPESLAAAGVRPREIGRIFDSSKRWIAASQDSLLHNGAEHAAAFEAVHGSFYDAATTGLSTESKAVLLRILSNRSERKLPIHFQVVERSPADWDRISEALHREEFAQTHATELSPADHSVLDAIRLDLAVRRARLNLNQLLEHVDAAWKEALKNVATDVESSPLPEAKQESPVSAATPE
jgi:HEAT repeat protein